MGITLVSSVRGLPSQTSFPATHQSSVTTSLSGVTSSSSRASWRSSDLLPTSSFAGSSACWTDN
ncbi:unnamed protein product [Schistocephalus solidus]|uniref:Uncharacterized protein n=1 Tax=Schistocephalus solidus TaxID=70667 RepID=A0A3P7BK75_SCHSO|nr:unnamed protein product [Schistocephalus solidus]